MNTDSLTDLGGCVRCAARSQATHVEPARNGSQDAVCNGCASGLPRFTTVLTEELTILFENDPMYAYVKRTITPEDLAQKMIRGLRAPARDCKVDGKGIKNTCRTIGIKPTYKSIQEYLCQ